MKRAKWLQRLLCFKSVVGKTDQIALCCKSRALQKTLNPFKCIPKQEKGWEIYQIVLCIKLKNWAVPEKDSCSSNKKDWNFMGERSVRPKYLKKCMKLD